MKTFFSKMMSSGTGVSSKRFIGFMSAMSMIFIAIVDLFTDKTVTDYVFEGLVWLAIAGLGFIASERFASAFSFKGSSQNQQAQDVEQIEEEPKQ